MRKRLRKKKHLKEFRSLGFTVRAEWSPDLEGDPFHVVSDRFLDYIVDHGLECGGRLGQEKLHLVLQSMAEYESTTPTQQTRVIDWLKNEPNIVSFEVSDFWDLWYGQDPLDELPTKKSIQATPPMGNA